MKTCRRCSLEKPLSDYYIHTFGKPYPDCKKCVNDRNMAYQRQPQGTDAWMKRTYGIGLEEYHRLLQEQNGCCAVCKTAATASKKSRRLCIDHDHDSGKVRGLVCDRCNMLLGKSTEMLDILKSAVQYLERQTETNQCHNSFAARVAS